MATNRPKAEAFILKYINKIAPDGRNVDIYKKLFASMSDKDFDKFMTDIESGDKFLVVISPNFDSTGVTTENNLKVAEELGHNFFQKLWIEGKDGLPTYLTPIEYLVVDLPLRRASQLLIKKISVPDHNRVVDTLTNQPTGDSKGAGFSYPEVQVCAAMGLDNSLIELMKYRGGDAKGGTAFNMMISKYGVANLSNLKQYASGVESTKTLKTFLTACHLKSTLP